MMFAQWLNLLTTHFLENILVIKWHMTVLHRHKGEDVMETRQREIWGCCFEDWRSVTTSQRVSAASISWKRQEWILPRASRRSCWHPHVCLVSDFWPSKLWKKECLCFKPLSLWFVMAARPYFDGWPEFSGFWHFFFLHLSSTQIRMLPTILITKIQTYTIL